MKDDVDAPSVNPYPSEQLEHLLYRKTWIDSVQWHLEDIIRIPDLSGERIREVKRRIDRLNQERTDTVERLDDWFLEFFKDCKRKEGARMNSETPAWLLDRMSILSLKIYHMREQTERKDTDETHRKACERKLAVLLEQREDMSRCLSELIADIRSGDRYMKVYRQMKMYNDTSLNPMLYGEKKETQP